jgi:4-oxalocrotonate tautomerase
MRDHPLSRMMATVQDGPPALHGAKWNEPRAEGVRSKSKGSDKMPEITVSMAAGRTDEQKAGMMRDITQALVKNLGIDADAVVIQINEAPLSHKMKGGKTFVERAATTKK